MIGLQVKSNRFGKSREVRSPQRTGGLNICDIGFGIYF